MSKGAFAAKPIETSESGRRKHFCRFKSKLVPSDQGDRGVFPFADNDNRRLGGIAPSVRALRPVGGQTRHDISADQDRKARGLQRVATSFTAFAVNAYVAAAIAVIACSRRGPCEITFLLSFRGRNEWDHGRVRSGRMRRLAVLRYQDSDVIAADPLASARLEFGCDFGSS